MKRLYMSIKCGTVAIAMSVLMVCGVAHAALSQKEFDAKNGIHKKPLAVVIFGTASSGKSTIAEKVTERLGTLGDSWEVKAIDSLSQRQVKAYEDEMDNEGYDGDLTELNYALAEEIKKALTKNCNVIADTVFANPREYDEFVSRLGKYSIYTVLVYCSFDLLVPRVLDRNEKAGQKGSTKQQKENGDRPVISPLMQFTDMYCGVSPKTSPVQIEHKTPLASPKSTSSDEAIEIGKRGRCFDSVSPIVMETRIEQAIEDVKKANKKFSAREAERLKNLLESSLNSTECKDADIVYIVSRVKADKEVINDTAQDQEGAVNSIIEGIKSKLK